MAPNNTFKYTLNDSELDTLTRALLVEQPPSTTERFICYMVDGTAEAANLARHVEREVFEERFGLDDAEMKRIYKRYEATSSFFVAIDQLNMQPAGAARISKNSPAGFLSLNDAQEMLGVSVEAFKAYHAVDNLNEVWDLGTTVVLKSYRSIENHLVSQICYRCLYARAMHEGIKHYVSILDSGVRRTFLDVGLPWEPLVGTESITHEGSEDSMFMYGPPAEFPAGAMRGFAKAEGKFKLFVGLFTSRVFGGLDIDHRLMFDVSQCPQLPKEDVQSLAEATKKFNPSS